MVNDGWTTIGEISEVFDGPHATPKKIDKGPYFLSISSLENGSLDLSKSAHLSEADFKKWTRRVTPKYEDILFSYETRLGEAALMPEGIKACLGRRMGLLRPDIDKVFPQYLLFAYLSPQFQEEIRKRTNYGATVERIALKELPSFPIKIPPLPEQKAIAHILGSLDDKIELNRQMNETLEAMAQALFKSWFVDFDPVIDNALAAGNAIPDELLERAEQRKAIKKKDNSDSQGLFPDEFEFTEEMGWIPKGWEITNLKDHAEKISKGTTPSKAILAKADDDSTIPFLKVRDLDDKGKIDTQNLDLIPKSIHENALKRSILQTGDLLFSIAGTIGRVSIVPKELDNSNSNQALAFIRPKDDIKTYFLLQFLKSQEVQDEISSRVVQAVQANVSLTELGSLKFATASDDLFRKWHSIVQSWIEKINFLQMENSHLSKLRDTLLPKLMSGELKIADAAALVDEAV